jgi:hypothetical protein
MILLEAEDGATVWGIQRFAGIAKLPSEIV